MVLASSGSEDPRPALAERLIRACAGARTVVAYNATFERQCIEELASVLPGLAVALRGMELERLLFTGEGPREDLRRYCERDTWGLVKVLGLLRELVRGC